MFTLIFNTDNATFHDSPESEVCRILRDIALLVERGGFQHSAIRDINGNTIGQYTYTPAEKGN